MGTQARTLLVMALLLVCVPPIHGQGVVPAGDEFQVNYYPANFDRRVSVSALAEGDFVVVWTSQDSFDWSVQGQRFTGDGTAVGEEFQVNPYGVTAQDASVAAQADGGFVVVWQSRGSSGSDNERVQGQRYAADGAALGEEFRVNTLTVPGPAGISVASPSVSVLADDGFVVVWKSHGSTGSGYEQRSIQARVYAPDGTPAGEQFEVSTDTAHAQKSPSVACLTDGGFVLVWEGYESVKARRFSGDGIALGEEFQVNIDTVWIQRPSVSAPIDGGFVAVWRRGERIRGRRFATDGMALGEEFEIDAGPRALIPSVAAFADGDFVVVWAEAWESEDPILPLGSVHCRRFEAPRFALSGLDGKCLDIEGADPADSTSVNLFRCHGGENQRWRMDLTSSPQRIRGIGDKCLVPTSADESGDNPVVMGECDGQYDRWKLVSPGVSKPSGLIHLGTGRCLDVKAATSTDGTPTQLFECHGGANQTWRPAPVVCTLDSQGLCLSRERFRVEVEWRDYDGNTGSSWVVPVASDDSGLFWFFSEENWEMLIKVLDGCSINDRFWVYAAATTDVEYALRVTDTAIGTSREYLNPLGTASPAITDAAAFDTCSASSTAGASWADPEAPEMLKTSFFGVDESLWDGIGSEGLCVSSPVDLCLNDDRFLVEVEWRDYDGNTGSGQVVPVDARDSGILWFFSDTNWEMLVKVLDGCGINDHYWVFAAATTDVEYRLRVTDLDTGEIREYFNPLGTSSAAITDTHAFGACGL